MFEHSLSYISELLVFGSVPDQSSHGVQSSPRMFISLSSPIHVSVPHMVADLLPVSPSEQYPYAGHDSLLWSFPMQTLSSGFHVLLLRRIFDQHVHLPSPPLPQLHHPPPPHARVQNPLWHMGSGLSLDCPSPNKYDPTGWKISSSSDGLIMSVSSHLKHESPKKLGAHSEQV